MAFPLPCKIPFWQHPPLSKILVAHSAIEPTGAELFLFFKQLGGGYSLFTRICEYFNCNCCLYYY